MNKKVNFWLYNNSDRIIGLYGAMSQFVPDPKDYTYTPNQVTLVLSNLKAKMKRSKSIKFGAAVDTTLLDVLCSYVDNSENKIVYNQVRIYTVFGLLCEAYEIIIEDNDIQFKRI